MDFGLYPPEINSGRMYAGPGSGPMLAAAQAWDALADELYTAAGSYQSVTSELTGGPWSGPSSASMSTAAATYVTWLSATAAQAEQTAAQAMAAAAGYEAAFAIDGAAAGDRRQSQPADGAGGDELLRPEHAAIAATETQYAEMWAQDAMAMYVYAGSSASASALTPFSSPGQNTDPGGTAGQAAAVSQASSTAAGNAQSAVMLRHRLFERNDIGRPSRPVGHPERPDQRVSQCTDRPDDPLRDHPDGCPYPGRWTFPSPISALSAVCAPTTPSAAGKGWRTGRAQAITPPEEFPAIITNPGPLARVAEHVGEPGPSRYHWRIVGAVELDRRRTGNTFCCKGFADRRLSAPARRRRWSRARRTCSTRWGWVAWPGRPWPAVRPAAAGESGKAVTHARLTNRVVGERGAVRST